MADIESNLIKEVLNELNSLSDLPEKEKVLKNTDIVERIKDFRSMTDSIEDRRNNIINFTYQFIVILITVLGLFLSETIKLPYLEGRFIYFIFGTQLLASFIVVVIYTFQSNFRYPFNHEQYRQFGNKWKWFYYGNQHISMINENPIFPKYNFKDFFQPYLKGFSLLIESFKNEKINTELISNIQQLYLLQVHNYYKNRFYLQLINIQKYGMVISIFSVVLYLVIKLVCIFQ